MQWNTTLSFPMKAIHCVPSSCQYSFHFSGLPIRCAHSFVEEIYPRTASNQTYRTLFGKLSNGTLNAPIQVSRHCAVLQFLFEPALTIMNDVLFPFLMGSDIVFETGLKISQRQIKVRRAADNRRGPAQLALRVDKLNHIQPRPAVLALVAPRGLISAHRACPLNVPVGEKHFVHFTGTIAALVFL